MDLNNIDIKQTDEGISIPIATVNKEGDVSLSVNVDIDKNSLAYKTCEMVAEGNLLENISKVGEFLKDNNIIDNPITQANLGNVENSIETSRDIGDKFSDVFEF